MKVVLVVFCIVTLCSMALALANTATVSAYKAGYSVQSFSGTAPTFDGAVSPAGEWTDAFHDHLYSGWTMATSIFGCKYLYDGNAYEYWIIEFLSDTTNDAGDYVQLCYDGLADGGAAPQVDDILINYTGHHTLTVYKGTGTGWAVTTTGYTVPDTLQISESISASAASATPHWIVEIKFEKLSWSMEQDTWIRVAANDAHTGGAGLLTWPPTASRDVPNDWGLDAANTAHTIPEGLTVGVMVLLSSVAVIVGARYFRKQPRIP